MKLKKIISACIAIGLIQPIVCVNAAKKDKMIVSKVSETTKTERSEVVEPVAIASASQLTDSKKRYILNLKQLGQLDPIALRGIEGSATIPFGVRADEVVTDFKLKINYAWSPALIPSLSHLKVFVNDEVVATIPLPKEGNNTGVTKEINIDPKLLTDYNRVQFKLIGHYTLECEDPVHSSLWASVSNMSQFELTVNRVKLPNDLALLPNPFFDKRDQRKLELPFVFGSAPSLETLAAAGTVSSWFGALANYRKATFPALINQFPEGNAVVVALANQIPNGLAAPSIKGATVSMIDHPNNPFAKVLLISGRDEKELRLAASALSLGQITLTGPTALIDSLKEVKDRVAYDAPNFLPTDRAVKFGELVSDTNQMQTSGFTQDMIPVNMRLYPDLFIWRNAGVPIDLKYRYTPRIRQDKSSLNISINKNFVKAFPLLSGTGADFQKLKIPFYQDGTAGVAEKFAVPPSRLTSKNQVQFQYYFDVQKEGLCKDNPLDNVRGAIDPESTIDLSKFPHYTKMPNLGHFVNAGYPFTRMADLSETAVILPNNASSTDLETYLTVVGHLGEATGYPATKIAVGTAGDVAKYADRDLIVLGTAQTQPLLKEWAAKLPISFDGAKRQLKTLSFVGDWFSIWSNDDHEVGITKGAQMLIEQADNLTTLIGLESPLKAGKSVVLLVADRAEGLSKINKVLFEPELVKRSQSDFVVINKENVDSFKIGETYAVGSVPLWTKLHVFLSDRPVMLLIFVVFSAMVLAIVLYKVLQTIASIRLSRGK